MNLTSMTAQTVDVWQNGDLINYQPQLADAYFAVKAMDEGPQRNHVVYVLPTGLTMTPYLPSATSRFGYWGGVGMGYRIACAEGEVPTIEPWEFYIPDSNYYLFRERVSDHERTERSGVGILHPGGLQPLQWSAEDLNSIIESVYD